jgi:glycosyltransferase involved in cell wall biosynthesis
MIAVIAVEGADLNPHFIWVGGDPPFEFESWANRTGLGNRVTFTGSLVNPYPWIAALDVFTLTSRWESFPLVVLEAMTLGVPVVAFSVGDVPYQIGDAGRLVSEQDSVAAANEVMSLLRDRTARSILGTSAAARVRDRFRWTDFAVAIMKVASDDRQVP